MPVRQCGRETGSDALSTILIAHMPSDMPHPIWIQIFGIVSKRRLSLVETTSQLCRMSLARGRTVFVLATIGVGLRVYFNASPLLLLIMSLLFFCVFAGKTPSGMEQFTPVYRHSTAGGMRWGVAAVQGRRPYMEDMHQVVNFSGDGAHPEGAHAAESVGLTHFFGVFDGHGGKRAAEWAHSNLVDNLLREIKSSAGVTADANSRRELDSAVASAFLKTDHEFLRQAMQRGMADGSTGITCMLQQLSGQTQRRLLVANLGDSRAVMVKRNGSAEPLSEDHKPNRPDERARVQAAGGRVIFAGCWRVQGDLAVSRAFGDVHLKKFGAWSQLSGGGGAQQGAQPGAWEWSGWCLRGGSWVAGDGVQRWCELLAWGAGVGSWREGVAWG